MHIPPTFRIPPLITALSFFMDFEPYVFSSTIPNCYPELFEAQFFTPDMNVYSGFSIASDKNSQDKFLNCFEYELTSSVCLFTDESRSDRAFHAGYSIVDSSLNTLGSFRTVGFVSSFCVETMAILQAIQLCHENK